MKYKIFFLLLLTSCINSSFTGKNSFTHTAKGFALVEKQSFGSLEKNNFSVSHDRLIVGTKIRITNPYNKIFVETIVEKKIKYDNFYKISISRNLARTLDLNLDFPYVEINEIKLNKSFIAKKAITENIEKKIANKAPITKININNLSKNKKAKKIKPKNYSILVANFYNLESAKLLKKRLVTILTNSNYQLIYINRRNSTSYELLMGPYNTINKLKNDYIVLSDSNYEDLDIKINE